MKGPCGGPSRAWWSIAFRWLAANASMPDVRAVATGFLREVRSDLMAMADDAHALVVVDEIGRFLERPAEARVLPRRTSGTPRGPHRRSGHDLGRPSGSGLGGRAHRLV